jgi:CubicO group peptidase (beta-lactamase class C family)
VGSITKQFTAAAVLRAQELGMLHVDQAAAEHVPELRGELAKITLHQLLTHSSGLEAYHGQNDWEPVSRDEFIDRLNQTPLRSPPGAVHHYSNSGYSVLAAVLEIRFDLPYEEVLRGQILAPAGLTETGGHGSAIWKRDHVAHNYADGEDLGSILDQPHDVDGPFWNLRGNGGIHSTAPDLFKWHMALNDGRVLSKASTDLMFAPHILEPDGGPSHYGYGWVISRTQRRSRLIWHNGGDGVSSCDFRRYVDEDVVLIAASNDAALAAWDLTRLAAARIFD